MESSLQWNISCAELNDTTIVDVAQIIEKSTKDGMDATLPSYIYLTYVYVYELCDLQVSDHAGYPSPGRRLETASSLIKMFHIVEQECNYDCSDEIFQATDEALSTIVDDGSLSEAIQTASGDIITAVINAKVNSTFTVQTGSPSTGPTSSPTTYAPTKRPTPQPTPRPTVSKASKQTKSSKIVNIHPALIQSDPSPVTFTPTTAKSSKNSKVISSTALSL